MSPEEEAPVFIELDFFAIGFFAVLCMPLLELEVPMLLLDMAFPIEPLDEPV